MKLYPEIEHYSPIEVSRDNVVKTMEPVAKTELQEAKETIEKELFWLRMKLTGTFRPARYYDKIARLKHLESKLLEM
jgi:hypothetical protein